jgi:hypothetical protein
MVFSSFSVLRLLISFFYTTDIPIQRWGAVAEVCISYLVPYLKRKVLTTNTFTTAFPVGCLLLSRLRDAGFVFFQ